jgi:NADH dehydrogenase
MKIALIGGTGFVGSYLVEELLRQGHQPKLLVRPGSASKVVHADQCEQITGDVGDAVALRRTLQGCDGVIYTIGILREFKNKGITFEALQFEGAARTMDLAVEENVNRFILMSANGVKPEATPYQTTKYRAEQHLQQSGLQWTIFRPSVIFGDPKGKMEFCTQLQEQLVNLPLPAPLFYDGLLPFHPGSFQLAPVHIQDVATVFVKSLTMPEAVNQIYSLCGPDRVDWKTALQIIAHASGKQKWTVPAPALVVKSVAALLDRFEFFPLSKDQLIMLMEGNICESSDVFDQFQINPTPFNEAALSYLSD